MRNFPAVSLRGRLSLMICAVLAISGSLLVLARLEEYDRRKSEARDQLASLSQLASELELQKLGRARLALIGVSHMPTMIDAALNGNPEARGYCSATLHSLAKEADLQYLGVWDAHGDSVCSTDVTTMMANARERDWFKAVQAGASFANDGFDDSSVDSMGSSVCFGLSVRDDSGELIAAISAQSAVTPQQLAALERLQNSASALSVVDADGYLISSTVADVGNMIPGFRYSVAQAQLHEPKGPLSFSTTLKFPDGKKRHATVQEIGEQSLPLYAVASVKSSVLTAPLKNLLWQLSAMAAMAAATLVYLKLSLNSLLVEPARRLESTTDRLAAGNWDARTEEGQAGELAGLARKFDLMAARLKSVETARDRAIASVERASQMKDEFIGLMSHELRTPLTVIRGNAAVLRTGRHLTGGQRLEALVDISSQAERLHLITENMLHLARLEVGSQPPLEPIHLYRVICKTVKQFMEANPAAKITSHWQATDVICEANGDFVDQVLENLLSNALKFGPPGSPIDLTVTVQEKEALISVSDCGIGIDPDQSVLLFDPFFRDGDKANLVPGLGLGLAVCKRLVEAQGGTITAASRPGGGAIFTFALPISCGD